MKTEIIEGQEPKAKLEGQFKVTSIINDDNGEHIVLEPVKKSKAKFLELHMTVTNEPDKGKMRLGGIYTPHHRTHNNQVLSE